MLYIKNINNINKLVNVDVMYYCANENNVSQTIQENEKYVLVKGDVAVLFLRFLQFYTGNPACL